MPASIKWVTTKGEGEEEEKMRRVKVEGVNILLVRSIIKDINMAKEMGNLILVRTYYRTFVGGRVPPFRKKKKEEKTNIPNKNVPRSTHTIGKMLQKQAFSPTLSPITMSRAMDFDREDSLALSTPFHLDHPSHRRPPPTFNSKQDNFNILMSPSTGEFNFPTYLTPRSDFKKTLKTLRKQSKILFSNMSIQDTPISKRVGNSNIPFPNSTIVVNSRHNNGNSNKKETATVHQKSHDHHHSSRNAPEISISRSFDEEQLFQYFQDIQSNTRLQLTADNWEFDSSFLLVPNLAAN